MIETSKDLLFLILGLSIFILTVFLCWAIYYVIVMLKAASEIIKTFKEVVNSFKEKLSRLEKVINLIEEKVSHTASYLPLVAQGVNELINFLKKRKTKKEKGKIK